MATSSSTRAAQRGAKRQPLGRSTRLGTLPGMTDSSSLMAPTTGMEPISPRVYGWWGSRYRDTTSVCSTISPAYMTATRSHISATTPRSWVMRMMAVPVWSRSSRMRSRIWAWMVTSRAVVGSSAMSSSGSQARAMAIITRWAMPPDISCGKLRRRRSGSGMPTILSSCRARSRAARPLSPRWMRRTSSIWRPMSQTGFSDEVGCWKIMLIRSPRILRISSDDRVSRSRPSNQTSPASILPGLATRRRMLRLVTLLPQPDSPTRPMISPRSTEKSMPSTARTTPSRV